MIEFVPYFKVDKLVTALFTNNLNEDSWKSLQHYLPNRLKTIYLSGIRYKILQIKKNLDNKWILSAEYEHIESEELSNQHLKELLFSIVLSDSKSNEANYSRYSKERHINNIMDKLNVLRPMKLYDRYYKTDILNEYNQKIGNMDIGDIMTLEIQDHENENEKIKLFNKQSLKYIFTPEKDTLFFKVKNNQ